MAAHAGVRAVVAVRLPVRLSKKLMAVPVVMSVFMGNRAGDLRMHILVSCVLTAGSSTAGVCVGTS